MNGKGEKDQRKREKNDGKLREEERSREVKREQEEGAE